MMSLLCCRSCRALVPPATAKGPPIPGPPGAHLRCCRGARAPGAARPGPAHPLAPPQLRPRLRPRPSRCTAPPTAPPQSRPRPTDSHAHCGPRPRPRPVAGQAPTAKRRAASAARPPGWKSAVSHAPVTLGRARRAAEPLHWVLL